MLSTLLGCKIQAKPILMCSPAILPLHAKAKNLSSPPYTRTGDLYLAIYTRLNCCWRRPSRHIHRENRCKLTMETVSEPDRMMFQDQTECGVRYLSLWYGCSSVQFPCIVGWQFCGMMILVPISQCRSENAFMMSNIIWVFVWIQNLDDHDDDSCQQVHTIVRVCKRCYPAELLVK